MLEKRNKYNIYLNRNAFISIIIKSKNEINSKKIFFYENKRNKRMIKNVKKI